MIKDWLSWITYAVFGIGAFFLCLSLWYTWQRPASIPPHQAIGEKTKLPERAFSMPQESYDGVGEPIMTLKTSPITLQLPDLRQQLNYFGKNNRPDAVSELTLLNFGFPSSKSTATIAPEEKLYITFDRNQKPPKFIFSPNNEKTPLWIEAIPRGNEAAISVKMINEKGEVIQTPAKHANFNLREKDQTRNGKSWELGKWRVDATLLSRQKGRWYGQDQFFERHGGDEYAETVGKERIDFIDEEAPYSVFVNEGGTLVWVDERWKEVKPGDETTKYPLLFVKKISDRVMNLELWNVEGKGKVNLNLLKSADMKIPPGIQQNFKFVGAKTRSQFIFEINKARTTLKPKDWLLLTKQGWIKLTSPEQIDDYVNRRLTGPLFVFDGVTKKGDTQVISGTLFNASRTDMQPVELPVQQSRAVSPKESSSEEKPTAPEKPPNPKERPTPQEIKERREQNHYPNEINGKNSRDK